ncbi:hypothetical protein QJQ45_023670 [Haematococcus lacustris]|nr:hypothetical protein QJQ45_023670 [Haematococcus lacustris]
MLRGDEAVIYECGTREPTPYRLPHPRLATPLSAVPACANSRARMTQAQCNAVMTLLQRMAGEARGGTAGSPHAKPEQFDAWQLSMAAWSLGKLKPHLPAATVTSACTAIARHSASSEAMKRGGWRDWSNLLHSLATAGMQCSSSPDLTRLCDQAVQLLHGKLARGAGDQDISMTLWAMAKSGYTGSAQPLLQSVTAATFRARQLLDQSSARAQAGVPGLDAQNVSNILYTMGLVLWHDKEVCRQLAERAPRMQQSMSSQNMVSSLYALARLGYLDSSVRSLAAGVAKADLAAFKIQELTNLLYARSMFLALFIHQAVSSGHSQLASEPQLKSMAAALWRECSRRGQSDELWGEENLTQLHTASQWLHACTGGQIFLTASTTLQELLAKAAAYMQSINATIATDRATERLQLVQAEHVLAVISQDYTQCAQLLVLGLTRGISVDLSPDFLPDGSISGVVAHAKLHQLTQFNAGVMVNKAVFDQLASDSERAAFMREQVRPSLPEAEAWRQLLQAERIARAVSFTSNRMLRGDEAVIYECGTREPTPYRLPHPRLATPLSAVPACANSRARMTQAQCNAVMTLLQRMAGEARGGTAGSPHAKPEQFDAWQLSMAAWSLGKLKPHLPAATVTSACTAIARHSASSEAMKRGGWRDWSNLLHSLATAGMQCSSSPDLTRLCDQAMQLLHGKLARGAGDQDISMTLWAMAKSGYTGSAQPLLQSVTAATFRVREEARQLLDQSSARAQAGVPGLDAQNVSNILYTMGLVLWHDKEVCRQLAERAPRMQQSMSSQNMVSSLYALARLGYLDSSVRSLAAGVAKADLAAFKIQELTKLLYARSMFLALFIHQAVSSGHSQLASEPQLKSMAAALWRECSRRGQSDELWGEENLTQLHTASQWLHACTGGQIFLTASTTLQELLGKAAAYMQSINATIATDRATERLQLVQAEHVLAVISQDYTQCAQLLVLGLTRGISVDLSPDFLPDSSISGVVAHAKLHQLTQFNAGVMVNKAVFDQLASDSERAAFMREQVRPSLPEAEAWRQLLQAERIARAVSFTSNRMLRGDEAVIYECGTREPTPYRLPHPRLATPLSAVPACANSRARMTQAQCNAVMTLLQRMAGEARGGTAGSPHAKPEQFDAWQLGMAAWSLGKLKPHLPHSCKLRAAWLEKPES